MLPIYSDSPCCGAAPAEAPTTLPMLDKGFVTGSVSTPVGSVPQVASKLRWQDRWGATKARWGVGRMDYAIDPGLYALGNPDRESPVLVSANYKMSFDRLRSALPGRDAWILVLDTKGINVWCAAGKGTFGTEELAKRIETSGLKEVVSHRSVIVPQLGAPGVAAHTVKKLSGFGVRYGPINAEDLPAYMDAGFKATHKMRLKTFPLRERAVLIPIELVETIKPTLIIAPVLFLLGGIGGPAGFWANALHDGSFAVLAFLSAVIGGAVLNPASFALSSRTGFFDERALARRGRGGHHAFPAGARSDNVGGTARLSGVAADHPGRNGLSGDEFYRCIHLYIPLRGEQRDALGAPHGDRYGRRRPSHMDCLTSDCLGGSRWIIRLISRMWLR